MFLLKLFTPVFLTELLLPSSWVHLFLLTFPLFLFSLTWILTQHYNAEQAPQGAPDISPSL